MDNGYHAWQIWEVIGGAKVKNEAQPWLLNIDVAFQIRLDLTPATQELTREVCESPVKLGCQSGKLLGW